MAYKVCHVEPTPPSQLRPELTPLVDAVAARALAKTKEARFTSAPEMSRAIADALSPRASFAAAATVVAPAPAFVPMPAPSPMPTPNPANMPLPATGTIPLDAVDRVTQALASYVGPIAKVMVKKAAADAKSYRELCLKVSERLATAEERARFLKQMGVG